MHGACFDTLGKRQWNEASSAQTNSVKQKASTIKGVCNCKTVTCDHINHAVGIQDVM